MRCIARSLLLATALALTTAPAPARAASAEEKLAAARDRAQGALATVLHRRPDGTVLRATGLWLEPGGDLLLVPLDRVLGGGELAVIQGSGPAARARLAAGDPQRRLAVLQVKDLSAPASLPRVSKRYPRVGERLPLLTGHAEAGEAEIEASTEAAVRLVMGEEEPPAGAVLLDARGDAAAMVIPAVPGRDAVLVPLLHAAELRRRVTLPAQGSRKTPAQALETCAVRAALAEPGGRGCVDPNRVDVVVRQAADAAEAVVSAELGRPVSLSPSGWTQQVLARLEGRGPLAPVDWAAEAEPLDQLPGPPEPLLGFVQDELFFERGELRVDRERALESFEEAQALGTRAASVVMISPESAWVKTAGSNVDGSRWAASRHWHAFAGGWALDVAPDDEALAGVPDAWPEALDELPWLRNAVMNEMIVWLREREAPPEEAAGDATSAD